MNLVRLKLYKIGPRGGRKCIDSQTVSASNAEVWRRRWEQQIKENVPDPENYEIVIQDGNIRSRV